MRQWWRRLRGGADGPWRPRVPPGTTQSRPANCVQTVLAWGLDRPVAEIEQLAGSTGPLTAEDALRLLALTGVPARAVSVPLVLEFWEAFSPVRGRGPLEGIGVRLPKGTDRLGHAVLLSRGRLHDPATGTARSVRAEDLHGLDWLVLVRPTAA